MKIDDNLRGLPRVERLLKETMRVLNDARSAVTEEGPQAAVEVIDRFLASLNAKDRYWWNEVDRECRQAIER
jgi:hypothetical protein